MAALSLICSIDNLIFDKNQAKVLAVLDWELSTIGDTMCDIGFNCLIYQLALDMPALKGIVGLDHARLGIPVG